MRFVELDGIDAAAVAHAVGPETYARGVGYAEQRAVLELDWDDSINGLRAVVAGSDDQMYLTTVYFTSGGGARLDFAGGECSCYVGFDCKHVVAAVLTAAGPAAATQAPGWSLQTLFGEPAAQPGGTELGIELSLVPARSDAPPTLAAKLVRPGRREGWIAGGMSWNQLEAPYHFSDCRPAHVKVLKEIYALYRTCGSTLSHYYTYRDVKTIDLAALDSRQLWALLDEADEVGLALVYAGRGRGALDRYTDAEVVLDITTDQDTMTITPVLGVDGVPGAIPVRFLGANGHGLVYRPVDDDPRFGLARLASPIPAPLQQLVLDGHGVPFPATEATRFGEEFYPRLRGTVTVSSSDGSFVPPEITGPTLVLSATHTPGHRLALDWEWLYQVGDREIRTPLDRPAAENPFRDPTTEQALLDVLPLTRAGLARRPVHTELRGLDTMRFCTEGMALLADTDGVVVEVHGEAPDYREAGDSLRIKVSTAATDGSTDWFDLGVRIMLEDREIPFTDVFTALASGASELLLPDGAYFSLCKPELLTLRNLIEEARALQDKQGDGLRISRYQVGLWEELAALGVVERQATAWTRQVSGMLALDAAGPADLPAGLTAELRPYQRDGFGWLAFLWQHRLGGILADDMGLGKTIQALALICHVRETEHHASPFLILAPTSVVANWAAEAARFAPDLSVVALTDTLKRRGQDLPEVIAGADVVVTSYTLFRLDYERYAEVDWSGLIMDEAQFAKNHQSKLHQCAKRLPTEFKLAITGTPMENNLMELWALLSITAPGLFPNPANFKEHYARRIERQGDVELLARLRRRIKPLMRRRTKEQVAADLPEKQVQVMEVELDPRHRTLYQRRLQRERQKILGLLNDVDGNRFTILSSLTLLRRLALHPGLADPADAGRSSAKIETLIDQLAGVIEGGHRALVFSQFTGFLSHVRDRLDAEGIAYCYLDGKTRNRARVVEEFKQGDAPVFLISLKAGGFGLNLTEADYCFLLDPWWNPATEAQAVDRTHRIGQTRNVMVYRLISRDTIEEKVLALSRRKAELFSGVMDDGNAFGSTLDAADIRALLAE